MAQNLSTRLLNGLVQVLEPLEAAVNNGLLRPLLTELGWQLGSIDQLGEGTLLSVLADLPGAVQGVRSLITNPPTTVKALPDALGKVDDAVAEVLKIKALFDAGAANELKQLPAEMVDYLAAQFFLFSRPSLFHLLRLMGVIRNTPIGLLTATDQQNNIQVIRRQVIIPQFDFTQLVSLIEDPVATLKKEYGLQNGLVDPNGTADKLFPRMVDFLASMGLEASYGTSPSVTADFGTVGNDVLAHTMRVYKTFETSDDSLAQVGAAMFLEPDIGLVLTPLGSATLSQSLDNWTIAFTLSASGTSLGIGNGKVTFPQGVGLSQVGASLSAIKVRSKAESSDADPLSTDGTLLQLGGSSGTRFEFGDFMFTAFATLATSGIDFGFDLKANRGAVVIGGGDGDGFLSSVLPSQSRAEFNFDIGWSRSHGLHFGGQASLEVVLPLNITVGPVTLDGVRLRIATADGGIDIATLANVGVELGPVSVSVEGIGPGALVTFPSDGGNIGPANAAVRFRPPTGLGIAVDAGPVSGGGFISFDEPNHRYFGALELSIYSVSVKAFGIIETQLPTGPGFSFLIIISAEFTPIQLGFGFTLLGVGGLAGINRTVDSDGLLAAIRKGDLENILFPTDVIDNAPAILHDLETIFPPTNGHFLFGPMAKIGWGTPTLVDGELGLILELPGPRLTVLGTVHAALPTADEAVVELNLDVGGVLDFPKKSFSLDASLHDSRVGDFPVSGDMSMRVTWGQDSNFALSVGGFNPHYNPPAGFPKLNPVTVDLGENGNPSINLHGYMALTSNTAQVGAMLEARVSKGGADLYGFIGFDALFIFSPFSFTADIEGGVKVNFHGAGFSLHFHGTISGPSPWHLDGQVCVSILWWDACVGFSVTMGGESKPTLPGLDPWTGSAIKDDGTQDVPGLQPALQNQANWGGNPPAGSFQVVTLVAPAKPTDPPPVDPLGSATVQQKAVPLDVAISAFAGTKPSVSRTFDIKSVTIGEKGQSSAVVTVTEPTRVSDLFAPAQFQAMKDADKLSSPSFVPMHGGFTISSNALSFGTSVPTGLTYDQFLLGTTGLSPKLSQSYDPSQDHVTAVTARSATAKGGIRGAAQARFVDPTAPAKLTLTNEGYVLAQISTLKVATGFSIDTPVSRPVAFAALLAAKTTSATAAQTLQIMPSFNALR